MNNNFAERLLTGGKEKRKIVKELFGCREANEKEKKVEADAVNHVVSSTNVILQKKKISSRAEIIFVAVVWTELQPQEQNDITK